MASTWRKKLTLFTLCLILVGSGFLFFRYFYVVGEGVKAGQLNYVVYKGYIFKTYEGKLIQAGFRSPKVGAGMVESERFEFSVEDKDIAETLMHSGGKEVELHYKEYNAPLPWRGFSPYIVDSIIGMKDSN